MRVYGDADPTRARFAGAADEARQHLVVRAKEARRVIERAQLSDANTEIIATQKRWTVSESKFRRRPITRSDAYVVAGAFGLFLAIVSCSALAAFHAGGWVYLIDGFTCDASSHQCVKASTCTDAHTATDVSGRSTDCSPYICSAGACENKCTSIADCVSGFVCDSTGSCQSESTSPSPSTNGCSCRTLKFRGRRDERASRIGRGVGAAGVPLASETSIFIPSGALTSLVISAPMTIDENRGARRFDHIVYPNPWDGGNTNPESRSTGSLIPKTNPRDRARDSGDSLGRDGLGVRRSHRGQPLGANRGSGQLRNKPQSAPALSRIFCTSASYSMPIICAALA
jgi:hypothetical protein